MNENEIKRIAALIDNDAYYAEKIKGDAYDLQVRYEIEYGEIEGDPRSSVGIDTKSGHDLIFYRTDDTDKITWTNGKLIDHEIVVVHNEITTEELVRFCETFDPDDKIELTNPTTGVKFKVPALLVDLNESEDGLVLYWGERDGYGRKNHSAPMKETSEELWSLCWDKIEEVKIRFEKKEVAK